MAAAAAMAACAAPDWGPSGYTVQGINNDPLVLRAMLQRLHLPGSDDPAGNEKNPERWASITAVDPPLRNCLRGNGPDYGKKWSSKLTETTITRWWSPSKAAFVTEPPRSRTKAPSAQDLTKAKADATQAGAAQDWANEQIRLVKRVVRKFWRGSDRPRQASTQHAIDQARLDDVDITSVISASTDEAGRGA